MTMPNALRRALLLAGLAIAPALATGSPALAQGKLEAGYTIAVARIPVGSVTTTAEIGEAEYRIATTGKAGGALRVVSSGEGTMSATGTIRDGRLVPARYSSHTTADDDTLDVTMTFEDGNVKELQASAPPPDGDRVELTDEHRRQVLDPLSALLIPVGEAGVSDAACARTLPIFDGRRRYDLKLAFKRIEPVKADTGYAGPAVVCAVTFQPIAGHRASSPLARLLSGGRDIEMALAPIAGTRVLAPFRVTVAHMLGNVTLQANRFETAPAPHTTPTTGQGE
jgi:uncharacterized protein DUF3108